ncbi:uncharacterized protein LOC135170579 isoform X1 [Diachasmimorpha longicaudata]|uniref:uncharacterized protein LOC135170579 isoform X1 n=1 Tax=Diachasmimorpha longicaudata TaxID=58733 RepID=UPI0030B91824
MKEEETVPESQCGITSAKRNSHRSSRLYLKLNVVIVLTTFCMQIHAYEDLHNLTMDGFGDGEEDISMRAPSRISVVYNSSTNSSRSSDGFDSRKTRRKRSVVHLYNMVVCATGCNPLAYKGYGCYCGFLGSGYPVDGIDRCCWMHDRCYDATGCPTFSEYFIPYYWKCYRGHLPICGQFCLTYLSYNKLSSMEAGVVLAPAPSACASATEPYQNVCEGILVPLQKLSAHPLRSDLSRISS